jgi:ribosomal protein S18 acetylase RimI-like enzyme
MDSEDARVAVYDAFRTTGTAPSAGALADRFGGTTEQGEATLVALAAARRLVRDDHGSIAMAHPLLVGSSGLLRHGVAPPCGGAGATGTRSRSRTCWSGGDDGPMDGNGAPRVTVRAASARDIPSIRELTRASGMFAPDDLAALEAMLRDQVGTSGSDHRWFVAQLAPAGFCGAAYVAREPFADRVWNLYFLAVAPRHQRSGVGAALLAQVVDGLVRDGDSVARVLLVETSSTDDFAAARAFYAREGFDREALIREYYGPDDHKIVYWLSLAE